MWFARLSRITMLEVKDLWIAADIVIGFTPGFSFVREGLVIWQRRDHVQIKYYDLENEKCHVFKARWPRNHSLSIIL